MADKRKQMSQFQDAVADLVDRYLKEGLSIDQITSVLEDEIEGVEDRAQEIAERENGRD